MMHGLAISIDITLNWLREQQKREEYAKSRKKNGSKGGRPRKTEETISKAHENHMVLSEKPYEKQ